MDFTKAKRIMFVCHGNICRSPMAECVFASMLDAEGLTNEISVFSAATSTEEIGNGMHPGAMRELKRHNVPIIPHRAVQLRPADAVKYDLFVAMDSANLRNMLRILGPEATDKSYRLLDFSERKGDIPDPWYTGNFTETWLDIYDGCCGLLTALAG